MHLECQGRRDPQGKTASTVNLALLDFLESLARRVKQVNLGPQGARDCLASLVWMV